MGVIRKLLWVGFIIATAPIAHFSFGQPYHGQGMNHIDLTVAVLVAGFFSGVLCAVAFGVLTLIDYKFKLRRPYIAESCIGVLLMSLSFYAGISAKLTDVLGFELPPSATISREYSGPPNDQGQNEYGALISFASSDSPALLHSVVGMMDTSYNNSAIPAAYSPLVRQRIAGDVWSRIASMNQSLNAPLVPADTYLQTYIVFPGFPGGWALFAAIDESRSILFYYRGPAR